MLNFKKIPENFSNLTKEFILSKLSEQEIVEYYLKINLNKGAMIINSPFREDKNPSFSIKVTNRGMIIRDFAKDENYDCFSIVQKLYTCNFKESLRIIANDFGLLTQRYSNNIQSKKTVAANADILCENLSVYKLPSELDIKVQPFTSQDIDYWNQYEIPIDVLSKFDVYSCKQLLIGGKVQRYYTPEQPLYCYKFYNEDGSLSSCKLYSPYAEKRYKWLFYGSSTDIEGFHQLNISPNPSNESTFFNGNPVLVITKSLKDVMVLYMCGIPAISLHAEGNKLSKKTYEILKLNYDKIYSLYDYDETGIKGSTYLYQEYNIEPLIIPVKSGCKDSAEHVQKYNLQNTKKMLDNLLSMNIENNKQ